MRRMFEMERDFFDDVEIILNSTHSTKDYLAWNLQLVRPFYRSSPLFHLAHLVDYDTLRWIKKGIPQLRRHSMHRVPRGDFHLEKDALKFIFNKAIEWIEFKDMDRNVTVHEYLNQVLWVVAKLITFQIRYQ